MPCIRFEFGKLTLDAELFDTSTAKAILAALPLSSSALTWGEEVYFDVPVRAAREKDARAVVTPGEIVYWPEGPAIAIGFGRTPISKGDETRLARPGNILAQGPGDGRTLRPGAGVWARGAGDRDRVRARADSQGRRAAAREPVQHLRQGARRRAHARPGP